jgi:protein-S-isoprenylcysteine O-methyltransferase Ste14
MTGVALGAAAFLLIFWVDAVSLKKMGFVKPLLWLAGIALSVIGLVLTVREPPRIQLPTPISAAGWALVGICAALFVYSLFVEIPFASAYVQKGMPSRLVTEGTYALCRHPGVLWLAGLLAGVFLASGSLWMLVALPLWTGLDVLYVVLQERLYFLRIFGEEYRDYQQSVPMLVPTSRSVRECARTIFGRGRK